MRVWRNLGIVFLCLAIAAAAHADLSTGTWESTWIDSDSWTGEFDPGEWEEQLQEGVHGAEGNQLTSFGENYLLDALLDSVTPLGSDGGLDGYQTVYTDVIFELYEGPWDTTVGAVHDVTMDQIVVESWKSDTRLLFSMTGDGFVTSSPDLLVSIEATFDSLVNPYTPSDGWLHEGDVGWAQITIAPVPIPGALLLGSLGFGAAGWFLRRSRE